MAPLVRPYKDDFESQHVDTHVRFSVANPVPLVLGVAPVRHQTLLEVLLNSALGAQLEFGCRADDTCGVLIIDVVLSCRGCWISVEKMRPEQVLETESSDGS